MILEEIRLSDFRCFFGKCKITFSTAANRNLTLIYAENVVGKTTLLTERICSGDPRSMKRSARSART